MQMYILRALKDITSAIVMIVMTASLLPEGRVRAADLRPDEIVTVLPKDAIPAILSPSFEEGKNASWLDGTQLVVGVEISGDSRAYPVPILLKPS